MRVHGAQVIIALLRGMDARVRSVEREIRFMQSQQSKTPCALEGLPIDVEGNALDFWGGLGGLASGMPQMPQMQMPDFLPEMSLPGTCPFSLMCCLYQTCLLSCQCAASFLSNDVLIHSGECSFVLMCFLFCNSSCLSALPRIKQTGILSGQCSVSTSICAYSFAMIVCARHAYFPVRWLPLYQSALFSSAIKAPVRHASA